MVVALPVKHFGWEFLLCIGGSHYVSRMVLVLTGANLPNGLPVINLVTSSWRVNTRLIFHT